MSWIPLGKQPWLTPRLIAISLGCFLLGALVVTIAIGIAMGSTYLSPQEHANVSSTDDVTVTTGGGQHKTEKNNFVNSTALTIIPRHGWLALPVSQPPDPLHTPVSYVIISHTGTETCLTNAQCTLQVRALQMFHIKSRNWWDIGYSFLVGGDGFAYVGRGWDAVGAHTYGYNNRSIGISFIGTFNDVLPPRKQIEAAKELIEKGVELGKVAKDYKLLAHRQVSATESPGKTLFENMNTWSHWSESP